MSRPISLSPALGLLVCLAITFAAAGVGGAAAANAGSFYLQLDRPAWAPPPGVFGPVWSVLYLMMGVAAWLVWRERSRQRVVPALALYGVQLVANALWSWLFFAWRTGPLAFAEVLVLLALVAATAISFWRISRPAGLLLLPYLGWVSFASALTWAVWQRNPAIL